MLSKVELIHYVTCKFTLYMPIISFRHAGLEDFYVRNRASGIRPEHRKRLARQLYVLDRMTALTDIPRSWNLHRLLGQAKGRWSISVNKNWRLTFEWQQGNVSVLDYEDYH